MYFAMIVLLLLILPGICTGVEAAQSGLTLLLVGKWICFWAVGVRLLTAGIRQVVQPMFTAKAIFGLEDESALPIVRELGFANLSMGLGGVCVLARPSWLVGASLVGGLYYGLAGAGHLFAKDRNAKENMAMYSDLWAFLVLAVFVACNLAK